MCQIALYKTKTPLFVIVVIWGHVLKAKNVSSTRFLRFAKIKKKKNIWQKKAGAKVSIGMTNASSYTQLTPKVIGMMLLWCEHETSARGG
jgi:membrane glycosyltransferase